MTKTAAVRALAIQRRMDQFDAMGGSSAPMLARRRPICVFKIFGAACGDASL
jgi:hypothetical protein